MAAVEHGVRGELLRPLRNRDFVFVWLGQTVSNLGDSMYLVALPWSVYRATGSSADMGLILAANVIPSLLLTLFGGAAADRWSRRTIIIACNAAAGAATAAAALLLRAHALNLVGFLVIAFVLGVVGAFFEPAYTPVYRQIVPIEDIQAANTLESGAASAASVAGPLLAALLLSGDGGWIVFAVEAASFFVAALSVLFTNLRQAEPEEPEQPEPGRSEARRTLLYDVASGLKLVLAMRWLRSVILVSLLVNLLCIAPMFVLLPAVTALPNGRGSLLSLAVAAQFAFSLLFALLVGKYGHRVPRGTALCLLAASLGLGVALLGLAARAHALIVPAEVFIGLGFAFNIVENSLLAEQVPEAFLSRVYSVVVVVSLALLPVGYASAGFLARAFGARTVLLTGGTLVVVICLAVGASGRLRRTGAVPPRAPSPAAPAEPATRAPSNVNP